MKILIFFALLITPVTTSAETASENVRAEAKWKLVWADEFESAGPPDPARWTNEVGFIRNRERQYYTAGDWRMRVWKADD